MLVIVVTVLPVRTSILPDTAEVMNTSTLLYSYTCTLTVFAPVYNLSLHSSMFVNPKYALAH